MKKLIALFIVTIVLQVGLAFGQCSSMGWVNYDGQNSAGAVTGGGTATPIQVTTFAQLKSAVEATGARVIHVMNDMGNGYVGTTGDVLNVKSDKTIIGVKPNITVRCSWQIKNARNVIVRNLICRGPGNSNSNQNWDCVNIENSQRVWFDHCTIMEGEDGNFDVVKGSDNVTATWCKFTYVTGGAHNFSNLIGSSDNETQSHGKLNVTYAYCWWDNVNSRCPRTRYGKIHVLNCYYNNVGSGAYAGFMSNVRVEGCFFENNVSNPTGLISTGGQAGVFAIDCNRGSTQTDGYNTVFTPPYQYQKIALSEVKSKITNATCGAGPNLTSATDCGCGTTPVNTDCNGVVNGTARPDNCGICSGGNTGRAACSGALQGENFCSAVGVLESTNTGFVGAGYVNFDNVTGSSATWNLVSTTGGSATIAVRYANGGITARGMSVSVNGTNQATLAAAVTDSWTTWVTENITLNLQTGANQITLTSLTADGGPNIDLFAFSTANLSTGSCTQDCNGTLGGTATVDNCGICVGGTTGKTACTQDCQGAWGGTATTDNCGVCLGGSTNYQPCIGNIEAEEACTYDGTIDNNHVGFSGEGFLNPNNALGVSAMWKVSSSTTQTATISFRYANGGTTSRDGDVYVNGNKVATLALTSTGAWATWRVVAVKIPLALGLNELVVRSLTADGLANLDVLSFSAGVSDAQCLVTGVDDISETALLIYPNPTSGKVELSQQGTWKLLDMMGKELKSGEETTVDLSAYAHGVYYLQVGLQSFKIIKN